MILKVLSSSSKSHPYFTYITDLIPLAHDEGLCVQQTVPPRNEEVSAVIPENSYKLVPGRVRFFEV